MRGRIAFFQGRTHRVSGAPGKPFVMFWRNGSQEKDVYFQFPAREQVCELRYYAGLGQIRFLID